MSLETLVLALGDIAERHERTFDRLVVVQADQAATLRDLVRLVGSMDDRLGRIEAYLRPPGQDGSSA